jgi:hypothetical protein
VAGTGGALAEGDFVGGGAAAVPELLEGSHHLPCEARKLQRWPKKFKSANILTENPY